MTEKLLINNIFDIKDKVFFITGATGLLGKEITKTLIANKSKVFGVDINIKRKNIIKDFNSYYLKSDITNKKSVIKSFDLAFKKFKKVDVLINCAAASVFESFEKRSEKSFDSITDTNLKGTFFCIQEFASRLKKKKKPGNIINIASIYGLISPNINIYKKGDRMNSEIYGASKAGIIQMTKYFATFLANKNIRVNAISPGGIYDSQQPQQKTFIKRYSNLNPMKRMANYNEIVSAVIYFSSDSSSYTTGHNLIIDGGMNSW